MKQSHATVRSGRVPAVAALAALALTGGNAVADQHGEVIADEIGTEYEVVQIRRIAGGLEHPWAVAFLPDGRYLVTERPGRMHLIDGDSRTEVEGVPPVVARMQGGLLDVSLHPAHESNGWIYFTYSGGDGDGSALTLARARLDGNRLTDLETVFEQNERIQPGGHYGGRIAWLADGSLLLSIGDRFATPERAQDGMDHSGAVLRLTDDGRVPENNPFADADDVLPEIYSTGHRNIQGMITHPETHEIWVTEHGPRGGDELNIVMAGANYGWPVVTKGRDYRTEEQFGEARSHEGMVEPVHEFLPTIAPSGLALVTADTFPSWEGNVLAGGLRSQSVLRVVLEEGEVVHLEELIPRRIGRIRDVREGPNGYVYLLTDEEDGGLYRIEPN